MRFAISVGSYQDTDFVELNLAHLRRIFGDDAPLLVSDGCHPHSGVMRELADQYGAGYVGERIDSGHFKGDFQNTINAIALAKANAADIAIKLNQRLVLLDPDIPKRLEEVFSFDSVSIALPGQCNAASILQPKSRFHATFPFLIDCLCFRASRFHPEQLIAAYTLQLKQGTTRQDSLVEVFWARFLEEHGHFATLPWLTEHETSAPFKYLRKIQNRPEDYLAAAQSVGITGAFDVREWNARLGSAYRPTPRV